MINGHVINTFDSEDIENNKINYENNEKQAMEIDKDNDSHNINNST